MSHEQEKPRRCGWIALGLVLLLLQGILPGSLLGGAAGLKSAEMLIGQHADADLVSRLFVLGGMITGLMVSAIVIMTMTLTLSFAVFLLTGQVRTVLTVTDATALATLSE